VSLEPDSDDQAPVALSPGSEDDADDHFAVRSAIRAGVVLLVAAVALVGVRALFVQSFVIPSSSMEPTLGVGDRVLVSRWDYRFGEIQRGDVIVFDGEGVFVPVQVEPSSGLARLGRSLASGLGVPVGEHDYVKRVIGLPGERVACCDAQGRITVDGVPMTEPYLDDGMAPSAMSFDVVIPEGRLWVMGDNRIVSDDSRARLGGPGNGTVPIDQVIGRVRYVWWPLSRSSDVHSGGPEPAALATTGAS
jgi:signal peptidase I